MDRQSWNNLLSDYPPERLEKILETVTIQNNLLKEEIAILKELHLEVTKNRYERREQSPEFERHLQSLRKQRLFS